MCFLDHGISVHNATKDDVLIQVIKESLYYRVKPSIDQFIAGMDSVGQFFTDYLKKWPQVFLPLFVDTGEQLTVNKFRGHYAVIWSGEGSNRRSEEQDTIYCFDQYLVKAETGTVPSLAEMLMFITGSDRVPPNGFHKMIKIKFC
ncbi:hypothetical protein QZH41_017104 [Actinostola sp. cb2023]|nr:hypothetical protein QZH41_017104 [Actinostola sp. cb2023]